MNQELGPRQLKWVEELESGKLKQAYGSLTDGDPRIDPSFCCLGVACQVSGLGQWVEGDYLGKEDVLPRQVQDWLQMRDDCGLLGRYDPVGCRLSRLLVVSAEVERYVREVDIAILEEAKAVGEVPFVEALQVLNFSLTYLNDRGWTFKKIAALIRKFPEVLFTGPA